jgi:phage terminase large subunit
MELEIDCSNVLERIYQAQTRIIVNEGSSRSTKTFSILQFLITQCLDISGTKVTASRAKLTWLKATVIPDFKEIMVGHFHEWDEDAWNKSESIYRYPNGSEFSFIGIDEHQKLHGRKQHYAWVNEAVEIELPEFQQLLLRTTKQVILDYNPAYESHWIYDSVIPRDDCTLIKSTYKDNPFLDADIRREIERLEPTPENIAQGTADEVSWKIYGLGERAAHKGLIFAKAQICKELPPEPEWKRSWHGLDFGFTNDPSALVKTVLAQGNLYFRQLFYKRGLTNIMNPHNPNQDSIEKRMLEAGVKKTERIWADSAEPKSIADLRGAGWKIEGARKGPDSVYAGIETMLRYNIFITEDSVDMIKEKNNYKWLEDRSGKLTNEPIDAWNHCWDGARYGCYMELGKASLNFAPVSLTGQSKWLGGMR